MARAMTLLLGLVWLLTTGAFANSCSSYKYKFAVEWASNNRYAREFCSSLPPSRSYNKDKAPDVLRNCIYTDVTTICACVNDKCKLPKCLSPKTVCKQDCGGYCAELKASDDNNCGSCGNKCSSGLKCVSGECKTACTAGSELCNGACKVKSSYTTDNENCGACKNKCTSPKPYCTNSQCDECTKNGQCGSGKKCSSNNDSTKTCKNNKSVPKVCSPLNLEGTFEDGKVCSSAGACEFGCSDTKACTDSTKTCKSNICVPKCQLPCSATNPTGACADRDATCSSSGQCQSSAVPRNGGFETPGGSPDTAAHWILQTALRRASTGAERANRAPSGNYFVSLYCASEAGRPNFPSSYDPQTPVASLNQAIPAGTPGGQFYSVSGKAAVVQITNAGCELFVDFGTRNADIGGFAYFDQVTEGTDYAPLYGEFYLYDTTTAITPLVIRMICTPTDTTSSFDAILNLDDIKIELAPYVP
ncbi:unnamed protein product [Cercospora beticola]|nr:unnamed protein product [Cercospora beticola]